MIAMYKYSRIILLRCVANGPQRGFLRFTVPPTHDGEFYLQVRMLRYMQTYQHLIYHTDGTEGDMLP